MPAILDAPKTYEKPSVMTSGSNEMRESYAISLIAIGDELARQPNDDYAGVRKKALVGSKWNTSEYVATAITMATDPSPAVRGAYAHTLNTAIDHYEAAMNSAPQDSAVRKEALLASRYKSEERRIFNLPARDLASTAMYEAISNTEPRRYLDLWSKAMHHFAATGTADLVNATKEAGRVSLYYHGEAGAKGREALGSLGQTLAAQDPQMALLVTNDIIRQKHSWPNRLFDAPHELWVPADQKQQAMADPLYNVVADIRARAQGMIAAPPVSEADMVAKNAAEADWVAAMVAARFQQSAAVEKLDNLREMPKPQPVAAPAIPMVATGTNG